MVSLDATLLKCPLTHWVVQPIEVQEPFEVGGKWFAWWLCAACDHDEHTRNDPGYAPAHPGPHLLALTPSTPPRDWSSRYDA